MEHAHCVLNTYDFKHTFRICNIYGFFHYNSGCRKEPQCCHKYTACRVVMLLSSLPPTGHVAPEGSRRVKAPSFRDNGTVMVAGCQPYAPGAFDPRSIPDDSKHTW